MRIARVSLGAAARGMTHKDGATSTASAESGGPPDGQLAGRVYLRTPAHTDRAEFVADARQPRVPPPMGDGADR